MRNAYSFIIYTSYCSFLMEKTVREKHGLYVLCPNIVCKEIEASHGKNKPKSPSLGLII
jgi:hypothetical protein